MSENHGKFIWIELMTSDREAAARFYGDTIGWTTIAMPDYDYTVFEAPVPQGGRTGVAGMMAIPPELQALDVPPNWTGYVAVDDCDRTAERIVAEGGSIRRQPEDIPGIGRFAVIADPHGAVLCIMTPAPMETAPPELAMEAPGQVGWHELLAGDCEDAFAFYAKIFGWTVDRDMDMAAMGIYRIFALNGRAIGGMMTKMPQTPAPCWSYYINVPTLDAAIGRLTDGGGKVVFGPQEVPGPAYIVNAVDPQGAYFALVAPSR